jgi:hypothetical protein
MAAMDASVGLVGYTDRLEAEEVKETATGDAAEKAAGKEPDVEAEQTDAIPVPPATRRTVTPANSGEYMPTVSPPILPAILLVGVFLVSRDDPRRRREEETEEKKEPEKAEANA